MEAIKVEGLVAEQCVVSLVALLPILTECNQEITPGPGSSNSRENNSSDEGTVAMIWEERVIVRATLPLQLLVHLRTIFT